VTSAVQPSETSGIASLGSAEARSGAEGRRGEPIDQLVKAVLYEGYALYPYRPSALKNQKRFAFGVVYPRAYAERALEASILRVEVVATSPQIEATVRYLRLPQSGLAREQSIEISGLGLTRTERDGLSLAIEATLTPDGDMWRYAVEVRNETPFSPTDREADREAAMDISPASTHVILRGSFLSSIDPPPEAAAAVASCRCTGLYPIIAGPGAMLASPIILPDYPQIAPQSPGDFFDGTEMDEMLTLRVLTMTDDEKREAAASDPKIAALIERTEQLGIEQTAKLHGVIHTSWPREGTRVRIRPHAPGANRRSDSFDVILAGKLATVAGIERDLEGRIHCAVTFEDDPGADLGVAGMPGHRFFFSPEELEVIQ
jgi:hypothetical protein